MTNELSVTKPEIATIPVLNPANISQLAAMEPAPLELMSDYWSPVQVGESKKVIFDRIDFAQVIEQNTGELAELECVLLDLLAGKFNLILVV